MEPAEPFLGRHLSKIALSKVTWAVIPGVLASALAGFVIYAVHEARAPDPAERLAATAPMSDGLSAEERRELTRQMLKARRENPEVPAEVRPTPRAELRPTTTGVGEEAAPVADPKLRTATPAPLPRPPAQRPKPEQVSPAAPPVATTVAVGPITAPTSAAAAGPAVALPPNQLPPVEVNTEPAPGAQVEPERRSFAANVFSSFSYLAGSAANATGNTVNWVIELPGRAISAGGKLLGGDSRQAPPPSPDPPPAKRNLL
jgi:uncharacterized membrane protein